MGYSRLHSMGKYTNTCILIVASEFIYTGRTLPLPPCCYFNSCSAKKCANEIDRPPSITLDLLTMPALKQ